MRVRTRADAMALLISVGAPPRLVRHAELVGEAAELIIAGLLPCSFRFDADFVRAGAVLHDAGKTTHAAELDGPGSSHEPAGEQLLLDRGISPELARVCRSHAQWRELPVNIEELLIALADKLWKGARVEDLESRIIDHVAAASNRDRWSVFVELDTLFEQVAAGADDRLARSRTMEADCQSGGL